VKYKRLVHIPLLTPHSIAVAGAIAKANRGFYRWGKSGFNSCGNKKKTGQELPYAMRLKKAPRVATPTRAEKAPTRAEKAPTSVTGRD